jgi:hypothetical protein
MNRVLLPVLLLVSHWSGCSGDQKSTAPTPQPPIWFSDVAPAPGTTLTKGTTVDLRLELTSYADHPGHIFLSLESQSGTSLLGSAPEVDIAAHGVAEFHISFLVPVDSSTIRLAVTFEEAAEARKPVVIFASYPTQ